MIFTESDHYKLIVSLKLPDLPQDQNIYDMFNILISGTIDGSIPNITDDEIIEHCDHDNTFDGNMICKYRYLVFHRLILCKLIINDDGTFFVNPKILFYLRNKAVMEGVSINPN